VNKFKRTFGFIVKHPLGRRHPIRSIWRFISWQLQCSLYPSKYFIKKFIGPVKFYSSKGRTGLTGNIYVGLHEFNDMMFLLHFLRSGDTFFDIGANAGAYTLLASGIAKAKSIAVEPVEATYDLLTRNLQLNQLNDKVLAVNAAAGATNGELRFTSDQDTTNHVIAENEFVKNGTVTVNVVTIDSLATRSSPALMKIDVEGFETEVLRGMVATLNQATLKAVIIELNGSGGRYGYDEEKIHDLLVSKGFRASMYDPFNRFLSVLENCGDENTIYCRDPDFINHRLQTADTVSIMGESI